MCFLHIFCFGHFHFFKHIIAHFLNPKFILMSLLIAVTIFITLSKSSSFLPSSLKSSTYNKWIIFLSFLCNWYPQSALFSSFGNGRRAIQKSNSETESTWNIPLRNWMCCDGSSFCFVLKKLYYYYYYLRSQRFKQHRSHWPSTSYSLFYQKSFKLYGMHKVSLRSASEYEYMTRAKTAVPSFCVICLG